MIYISYYEANIATIKPPMASPQECVGGTHYSVFPVSTQITVLSRITEVSRLMAVMGSVWQSNRIYKHIHRYRTPLGHKYT